VPALPPLSRLPQEIEDVLKSVGIDSGTRVHPVVGVREAKQHGHKAAFPQDTCLGILSASDVTSGLLEATTEAFEIMIGTRPQRLFQVRQQMGSQGDGHLLHVGHYTPPVCRKTTLLKRMYTGQELRLSFLTACLSLQEVSQLVNPAEASHQRLTCLLEHVQDG
jgi:hypothetical protein